MPGPLPYSITALLYAALAFAFWRANWAGGNTASGTGWQTWARVAILIPLGLHAWLLVTGNWGAHEISIGVGQALSAIAWLALTIYALSSLRQPVDALTAVILPVAALAVLLPLILPERPVQLTTTPLLLAHLAMAFLAYALFTIAALHAGVMSLLEKRLHAHAVHSAVAKFPPLLTLEKLLFTIIGIGFVLLTLALVSGILFSEQVFGKPFSFAYFTQHKTVFALLSWLIYAGLLLGRQIYGWRGRTAIAWSLTGFAMLVLAYLGSKVALQLLGR
ncbi:MAG: cytochrome c biogenesis protein CcsA [Pseudomonadota bacterium]